MEHWKATPQIEGYQVSNLGRVKHTAKGTIKGTPTNRSGYPVANLWHENKGAVFYVHDLVMAAFVGPQPHKYCVNHIDGVKTNNRLENLEYATYLENSRHASLHGLNARGERCGNAKLKEVDARAIRDRARAGERTSDLAREFGVGCPIVSQIKNGSRWAHLA